MFTSPGSVAFSIGSFAVHWYGILIAAGIFAAYSIAVKEAKRRGMDEEAIADSTFWVIIFGVLGARMYYVIFNWSIYSDNLGSLFAVWQGGLAIHGAMIGGVLAFIFYMKSKKLSWLSYVDLLIPGLILAQALGRWGNFFNSEAFGAPTDLPWGLNIHLAFRPPGFEEFTTFHPTFLYESMWNLLVFGLLVYLSRRWFSDKTKNNKMPPGSILASYAIAYSIGRFFIEGLRMDSLYLGEFRVAQLISIVLILGGIAFFINASRSGRASSASS